MRGKEQGIIGGLEFGFRGCNGDDLGSKKQILFQKERQRYKQIDGQVREEYW